MTQASPIPGLPELRDPLVVAAFRGWNDAADAASGAVDYLDTLWDARPLAALDPEDYYDFQVVRPTVSLVDGDTRSIEWPTTHFSFASPPGSARDVILVRGLEPNMRWRGFCSDILGIIGELGATSMITLGALLADAPHTRPVPVSGTAGSKEAADRLGLDRSRYEGPTGIVGVLQDLAQAGGMTAISFWAAVPHYVAQPPCPKATLALLRRVEDVLDVDIDMGDLPDLARAWERGVEQLASEDTEVRDYVESLERREAETDLPEASGEAIAREFERYLRRRPEA